MRHSITAIVGASAALLTAVPVLAGRPLTTDDAGTAAARTCQVESWLDYRRSDRYEAVVGPACGLVDGVELGVEVGAGADPDRSRRAGLGLKLALPSWQIGMTNFGVRFGQDRLRESADGQWRDNDRGVTALATTELSDRWALDLNLGHRRDLLAAADSTVYGAALRWQAASTWQLSAELFGDDRSSVQGGVQGRWWAVSERVALDFGWVHRAGPGDSSRAGFLSLGLCVYRIFD